MSFNQDPRFLGPFTKHPTPVLTPLAPSWFERVCTYNAAAILKDDRVHLLYRAEGEVDPYVSRIGLAVSDDGIHFERASGNPVLDTLGPHADIERRGCEDPRVLWLDGNYVMTYTAWDGERIALSLATSPDLVRWQKHGPIVPGFKSGAIVPQKIGGRYVMYFGDTNIWLATSTDLRHWEIRSEPVLRPRPDGFDSGLVEPGPPPLITEHGILLIYNSSDHRRYAVGQALFAHDDPARLIARTDVPCLLPEHEWEHNGKVNHVVFAEGLVKFRGRWHLYYGGADKVVGLATANVEA